MSRDDESIAEGLAKITELHYRHIADLRKRSDAGRLLGQKLLQAQRDLANAEWLELVDGLEFAPYGFMEDAQRPNPTDDQLLERWMAETEKETRQRRKTRPADPTKADPRRMAYVGRKPGARGKP